MYFSTEPKLVVIPMEYRAECEHEEWDAIRDLETGSFQMLRNGKTEAEIKDSIMGAGWSEGLAAWIAAQVVAANGPLKLRLTMPQPISAPDSRSAQYGFVECLLDFSFEKYATVAIARMLYRVAFFVELLGLAIGLLFGFYLFAILTQVNPWLALLASGGLVLWNALLAVCILGFIRVWLEAQVVHFKGPQAKGR